MALKEPTIETKQIECPACNMDDDNDCEDVPMATPEQLKSLWAPGKLS